MIEEIPKIIEEFDVDGSRVVLFEPKYTVNILGKQYYVAEGLWCEKDENGDYLPDWDLTWFWQIENEPQNYTYFEQDCYEVALHNLTNILGRGD